MIEVPSRGYQPIENYGVIGDLYTVALAGYGWLNRLFCLSTL